MSDVVEKNDVDITSIFNWGRVFQVVNPSTNEVEADVYMKLLGDADLSRARVYAMRKSAELRRKLKDEDSDERVAWARGFNEVEIQDLVNLIIVFSSREISNAARDKAVVPTPKPPKSNAKLEKMEKFQKEVDEYPHKRAAALADAISAEVDKLRSELSKRTKEDLYKEYIRTMIDEFCEREAMMAFEDMQVYLGCYQDDTYNPEKRFFSSFEQYNNLEPSIKAQFKDAFRSIDIEMSELKKLRRATL